MNDQQSIESRRIRTTCPAIYTVTLCHLCAYTAVHTAKARWGTRSWEIEETTLRLWYRLAKGRGKKGKDWGIRMGYSYLVTHPSTNRTEKGLTLLSGQHIFHSFVRVQDKISKLTSCMDFRMIQAMIKYFERSAVERIEENSNVCPCFWYDIVNEYTWTRPRRDEEQEVGK